jgi:hypothetical protein
MIWTQGRGRHTVIIKGESLDDIMANTKQALMDAEADYNSETDEFISQQDYDDLQAETQFEDKRLEELEADYCG